MAESDIATRRFYAWGQKHPASVTNPLMVWHAAWQQGGRHALLCSSELAELVPRLEAVTSYFRDGDVGDVEVVLAGDDEQEALPF